MSLFSKLNALENLGRSVGGAIGLNMNRMPVGGAEIHPMDADNVSLSLPSVTINGKAFDPSKMPATLGGMVTGLLRSYTGYGYPGSDKELFPSYQGYRPPQWLGSGTSPAQLALCKTNIGGLFFDAVISVSTEHTATITSHPVQLGANISDHMYLEPISITMEIAMSDAMDSMVYGQWKGGYTKSVSAYRMLCDLQARRIPITVLTRLNQYPDMVIESISVNDDYKSLYGLRATVSLKQVFVAEATTDTVSARSWVTDADANRGEAQPSEVPTSVIREGEIAGGMK
ncbi:phage baseplate protein [Allisonella histaminiformans]|uniref:phage baseplate protein n=1 Tax=Allisonella histaminiformans TaxID=209880 RepID=UPI002943C498|nr:hypothetical protein [Allisonella histaminiformans]